MSKEYKVENKWIMFKIWCNGKYNLLPLRRYTARDRRAIKLKGKEEFLAGFTLGFPNTVTVIVNL